MSGSIVYRRMTGFNVANSLTRDLIIAGKALHCNERRVGIQLKCFSQLTPSQRYPGSIAVTLLCSERYGILASTVRAHKSQVS